MYLPLEAHLGNEHEPLPYHEGAEDDHGKVEALEEELALVRPELLELEDLLVYHLPEHCFFVTIKAKYVSEVGKVAAMQQRQSGRSSNSQMDVEVGSRPEVQGVGGYATISYLFNLPHFSH